MDELLIEGIDDDLLRKLEHSALRNGQTIEAEVILRLKRGLVIEAEGRLKQAKQAEDSKI